jgi:hypothetical protein
MGINGFMKNITHDVPEIKKRIYDSLYVDCNYLLHYFIYNCKNDNDLYYKINNYIKFLFETLTVTQEVNLIFDGSYPHYLQEINPKKMTLEQRYKNKKESTDYDKQKIAPKMEIVKKFKTFISESVNYIKKMYKCEFKVLINDDYIDDEADFKILEHIYESNFKTFCIVSRDSDMILIAYSLAHKKNVEIDILSNLRPILFVDVNKLNKGYDLDYVLIMLLLGNDYLPKLSNVDYDTIIKNYEQYLKHDNLPIIKDNEVNYSNFINFLTYIILNKKIKYKYENLDFTRFEKYYNNIEWCLNKYKIINKKKIYLEDTKNVINIYNFIYC